MPLKPLNITEEELSMGVGSMGVDLHRMNKFMRKDLQKFSLVVKVTRHPNVNSTGLPLTTESEKSITKVFNDYIFRDGELVRKDFPVENPKPIQH